MTQALVRFCEQGEDVAILFARTPVPGRVKSRLLTHLTPEQACRLHCAGTADTAELLDQALPAARKWVLWSESIPARESDFAVEMPDSFSMAAQQGGDLGERMASAFAGAFGSGARRVVIFGSDSPTLPRSRAQQAFALLEECDVVLGPTDDGGYYLIGCRKFDRLLFDGVEWSSPRTLEQTRANALRLGLAVRTLDSWYDLDEWKDVERLLGEARLGVSLPRRLAAFLKQLEKKEGR
jgi:hypothetical protein